MSLYTIFANQDLLAEVVNHLDPWSFGNLYTVSKNIPNIRSVLNIELDYAILTGINSLAQHAKKVNNKCVDHFNATDEESHYEKLDRGYWGCYNPISSMVTRLRNKSNNRIVKAMFNIEYVEQMRCLMSINLPLERWRKTIMGIMLEKGNADCLKLYVERYCDKSHDPIKGFTVKDFNYYKSTKIILPFTTWFLRSDNINPCTIDDISQLMNNTDVDKRIFTLLFNDLMLHERIGPYTVSALLAKYISKGRYDLVKIIYNINNDCFEGLGCGYTVRNARCIIEKLNNDGESELMKLVLTANRNSITKDPCYKNIYPEMVNECIRKNSVMNLRILLKFLPNPSFLYYFNDVSEVISIWNKAAKLFYNRVLKSAQLVRDEDLCAEFYRIYSSC